MARAIQGSVSDEKQVRKASRSERWHQERLDQAWRTVLAMPEARLVFNDLLTQCMTFRSIFETSARIYYNSGRQDWGHFLIERIEAVDPLIWLQMQRDKYDARFAEPEPTKKPDEDDEL